jgi:hypothetical protein
MKRKNISRPFICLSVRRGQRSTHTFTSVSVCIVQFNCEYIVLCTLYVRLLFLPFSLSLSSLLSAIIQRERLDDETERACFSPFHC